MKPKRLVKAGEELWRYEADERPDPLDRDRSHLLCLSL
jgi:hypothetical protein